MSLKLLLLPALMALVLASSADAQDPTATRLMLDASASREAEGDLLTATLTAHAEAPAPAEAQAAVNAAITSAVEQLRPQSSLRLSTGGYRVYEQTDAEGRPTGWIAEQELVVETVETAPLLSRLGELQARGLLLQGLAFSLSDPARRALEDGLTAEALGTIRRRADHAAGVLGLAVGRVLTLRLGSVDAPPMARPMLSRMAAEAAPVPPVALPGRELVTVRVEAEVALHP